MVLLSLLIHLAYERAANYTSRGFTPLPRIYAGYLRVTGLEPVLPIMPDVHLHLLSGATVLAVQGFHGLDRNISPVVRPALGLMNCLYSPKRVILMMDAVTDPTVTHKYSSSDDPYDAGAGRCVIFACLHAQGPCSSQQ